MRERIGKGGGRKRRRRWSERSRRRRRRRSQLVELYSSSVVSMDRNQWVSELHPEIYGSRNSTLKS